jgi:hypothetical protein
MTEDKKAYTMNLGFLTGASDMNVTQILTVYNEYKGLDFLKQENPKLYEQIMATKDQIWYQINVLFYSVTTFGNIRQHPQPSRRTQEGLFDCL